jgi:hypothetical protein
LGQDGFGDISAAKPLTTIVVSPLENVVSNYKNQLKVESVNKSSVLALTVTGPLMKKSEDYLDQFGSGLQ